MALLDSFYGETPSYLGGLLGADELKRLQEQAQSQSNLGMATALLQAGAPSRTPGGGALAIAQGLQQGQQLYKQALNQGLQEKMTAMQLGEQLRKQKEAEAIRQFLPTLIQPGAVEQNWSGAPDQIGQYFKTGAIPTQQGPSTINRQALQRLALLSPETYARYKPEYKEVDGKLVEISPLTGISTVAGSGKLSYQDLGNVVVALDSSGKEVGRFNKGAAPQGPVSLQSVETENGVMTFNPRTGQYTPVVAGGQPLMGKGAALTEGQGNATAFGMRMAASNKIIDDLSKGGTQKGALVSGVPFAGPTLAKALPSVLGGSSETQQQYDQAKENFITAVLRKESGAVISDSEFEREDKKYFPQVNDNAKVIEQKRQARELAIKAMKVQAGKGAKFIEPTEGQWSVVR